MPNGIISKEEFERGKDVNQKLNILFNTVTQHYTETVTIYQGIKSDMEILSKSVNRWKKVHTGLAAGAGAVAGFFGGMFRT